MDNNGDNNDDNVNAPIKKIISKRGHRSLVVDDHKFYVGSSNRFKCTTRWRCVMKYCPAKLYTDENVDRLCDNRDYTVHNHKPYDSKTIHRQFINAQCKELAIEDLKSPPKEIIRRVVEENKDDNIEFSDTDNRRTLKNVYEARSKFIASGGKIFPRPPPPAPRPPRP